MTKLEFFAANSIIGRHGDNTTLPHSKMSDLLRIAFGKVEIEVNKNFIIMIFETELLKSFEARGRSYFFYFKLEKT